MPTYMDYMISPLPIRLYDNVIDLKKLRVQSLLLRGAGHLPGRIMQRKDAKFDYWAFVYIGAGRGYFQAGDGQRQTVEAGSLFCLYPGEVFQYGPEDEGFWDEYYFSLEGTRIQEWLASWYEQPETVKHVGTEESFFSKIELIFGLLGSGVPANQDRAALALESMLFDMSLRFRQPETSSSRTLFIHQLLDDLGATAYGKSSAGEIAARHHISIPTLRRIVHDYTGYPLGEFVHRLKIAEAKKLLLNTDKTVMEIAGLLGYSDMFYFSRLFKKLTDAAPTMYRSQMG
ncbi:helix-turn-helix domain-containing protein [Paenibacillus sacheonensis]|uniref:Helix-turn-helix domain-containing protein n=1 Tax=Paenibacillus sacheonensis TaxID=742054 RepID=A0A7X4YVC8_9BACL|nr:AraC family transcriptional regulator [Paenibacillus sacheonensis]MBM7568466.1 AraC-like DNA-binding protein [Paenibacillus sacheonensis]NBC72164.1 helix-turn-helix domain-containing protein [Paenibacillus sacheonensis]